MTSSYFPLRWEGTGDHWWYASPIEWAAANGHYDLVRELLHLDSNLLIQLTSLRRIRRLEIVWDDETQYNNVAQGRSQVAKLYLESESNYGDNSFIDAGYGGWLLYINFFMDDMWRWICGRTKGEKESKITHDDFSHSGPSLLTNVDWGSAEHRRSVAACLVQGVYILEGGRLMKQKGRPHSLASPWWEFFHFQPIHQLVDDKDQSIFGIVYEFRPPYSGHNASTESPPKCVIAFRGTMLECGSVIQDSKSNLRIILQRLHRSPRFKLAMEKVEAMVKEFGGPNIWIAGHSLGSAMGMVAGKEMASTGIFLKAFFFNPPFVSAPIEIIKYEIVKHGIRIGSSCLTAGLIRLFTNRDNQSQSEKLFTALSPWVPALYVHPDDHICSEYIGYFERRKIMKEMGAGRIERLATQNSVTNLCLKAMRKDSDPIHRTSASLPRASLPSANLITNRSPAEDIKQAHGLHQWWSPELQLPSELYKYY